MAFGKDKQIIGGIAPYGGSFAQKARATARRPRGSGGGGGAGFHWRDCYKPAEYLPGDIVRLIRADYTQKISYDGSTIVEETFPYVMFREHHDGDHSCVCSAGPLFGQRGKADPCPSCDIFWEDVREKKAKKSRGDKTETPQRMRASDMFAWNVWDYGTYVQLPEIDRSTGSIKMKQDGTPFYRWEKGNPNDPQYAGKLLGWKQGMLLPWSMTGSFKESLLVQQEIVSMACLSCGNRSGVVCTAKLCGGCKQVIYNPNSSPLNAEQRREIDNNIFTCPQCKHVGYVEESIQCMTCQKPMRASIFDVDLQVMRQRVSANKTELKIINFSEPRPIQVADPNVLQTIQPLDLLKKFAPTPPDVQQKIMKLPPPRSEAPQMPVQGMPQFAPTGMPSMGGMPPMAPMYQVQQPMQTAAQMPPMQQVPQQYVPADQQQVQQMGLQGYAVPYNVPGAPGTGQPSQ